MCVWAWITAGSDGGGGADVSYLYDSIKSNQKEGRKEEVVRQRGFV